MKYVIWFLGGVAATLGMVLLTASTPEPVEPPATVFPDPAWHDRHYPASETMETAFAHVGHNMPSHTAGPSADIGRLMFDGPVDVLGVLVSVDIPNDLGLYEILVGKNMDTWVSDTTGALFQLSYDSHKSGRLDGHIWFPEPYELDEGDWLSVVGWMFNESDATTTVHPEVIVYYKS